MAPRNPNTSDKLRLTGRVSAYYSAYCLAEMAVPFLADLGTSIRSQFCMDTRETRQMILSDMCIPGLHLATRKIDDVTLSRLNRNKRSRPAMLRLQQDMSNGHIPLTKL
jgi:hypothetical protein